HHAHRHQGGVHPHEHDHVHGHDRHLHDHHQDRHHAHVVLLQEQHLQAHRDEGQRQGVRGPGHRVDVEDRGAAEDRDQPEAPQGEVCEHGQDLHTATTATSRSCTSTAGSSTSHPSSMNVSGRKAGNRRRSQTSSESTVTVLTSTQAQ